MTRVLDAVKRANTTTSPEGSVVLRASVLATVMLGVLGTWVSGAASVGDALLALVLLPAGAWISYRRRDRDNTAIKLALTLGAVLALMRFFGDVRIASSVDDTRAPLGALFLAVQVLHGFDLPQRRDLGFTLASSLTLIALAAVNSNSGLFGGLLLVYAASAAVSMAALQRSAARAQAEALIAHPDRPRVRFRGGDPEPEHAVSSLAVVAPAQIARAVAQSGSGLLRAAAPVMAVGLLVFLILPRTDTATLGTLPFSGFPSLRLPSSAIFNPGLEGNGQTDPSDNGGQPLAFSSEAYFGFSNYVDLRTVGELPDTPILRVRADRPRFWRGMVFDRYDGTGWTRTSQEPRSQRGLPVTFDQAEILAGRYAAPGTTFDEMVQTFELLGDTPNLVFGASDITEVYLSAQDASRWDDGTVSTSGVQSEGIVYSVVSIIDDTPADVLRTRTGPVPPAIVERYTQLPSALPQRVYDLAAELTVGATSNYAKAEAVEDWIGANTVYTLDAPPPPDSGDLADHFLFESQAGWCEPIATGMVALLRAVDVPARFATGFQPGDRNPVTGVWDVAMSDAHAWVEVWVPANGWIAFDPTGAVPQAVDGHEPSRIPLFELAKWLGASIAGLVPGSLRVAFADLARSLAAAPFALVGLLAAVAGASAGAVALLRRRATSRRVAALDPFGRLALLLDEHGIPRDRWQTPREFVRRVRLRRPDLPVEPLEGLLVDEEQRRYADGDAPVPDPRTDDWLHRIRDALTPPS